MLGLVTAAELLQSNDLEIAGDAAALANFAGLFDSFERRFPIMHPQAPLADLPGVAAT